MENIDLTMTLSPLYETYNNIIKPLLAEIEVRYERFPVVIFNEIRAYNDHIARCYMKPRMKSGYILKSKKLKAT